VSDWRLLGGGEWRRRMEDAGVSRELTEPLSRFLVLLGRWEGAVDLVGRVDPHGLLRDHVVESLAGLEHLPEAGKLLDVGSGNGFPAIPLLLGRRGVSGVLLEPRERRWAFLREAVRELGLGAEVRRERLAEHRERGYAALTVRALELGAWRSPVPQLLVEDGVLLWWTTRTACARVSWPGMGPVLTSALPVPERGVVAVWRRCST